MAVLVIVGISFTYIIEIVIFLSKLALLLSVVLTQTLCDAFVS